MDTIKLASSMKTVQHDFISVIVYEYIINISYSIILLIHIQEILFYFMMFNLLTLWYSEN